MKKQANIIHSKKLPTLKYDVTVFDLISLFKGKVLLSNILPVFTGLWLALYFNNLVITGHLIDIVFTITGSTLLMAGALTINNWYDADIDRLMERTQSRPTVTGSIPLHIVLSTGVTFSIIGFLCLLFLSYVSAIYGFIGWFTYVVLYTMWSKRKYTWNTLIGSISGAVTPLIGWAVISPTFHVVPITLAIILFIWQMPHTYAIAIRKKQEYNRANVPLLPVVRGITLTKRRMLLYVSCLLPFPFFLSSIGPLFVLSITILNITWLMMAAQGFSSKNNAQWARTMFLYSVNYIVILFSLIIIFTLV
ncbi:heme o synthase [Evansella cellulosilytica]|uniref:Protoheme IX farnesyltransferase n=1 Tax=Evansella cellulosilytica (strain ATCC 21833 / DSM 2522 / FERM P-1141 / JCM 9156 / N-4) TaxID=649639 RepID=E6TR63_EVAC2|nr:heme o synthase [Evansella cellulosilytica]ADU30575.1 protoheme IX farnesyltransferase [Evansella cellulosilytica DSM 2522]